VGLHLAPGAPEWLAYDRHAIASGELWRLVTGHLIHWSRDLLAWDVAVFAALGALCERRSRRRFLVCAVGSALAISAVLWICEPQLGRYGGLSGIDSALFALLAVDLTREQWRDGRRSGVWLALALFAGFALKVAFEFASGTAVFVGDLPPGIVPVPAAHLAGAAVGIGCAALSLRARDRQPRTAAGAAPFAAPGGG
jgi:rhomboid family GlyGly-CTERM serine protease